jgi:hypothetical protein
MELSRGPNVRQWDGPAASPARIVCKDFPQHPEKTAHDPTAPLASIGIDTGKEVFHVDDELQRLLVFDHQDDGKCINLAPPWLEPSYWIAEMFKFVPWTDAELRSLVPCDP